MDICEDILSLLVGHVVTASQIEGFGEGKSGFTGKVKLLRQGYSFRYEGLICKFPYIFLTLLRSAFWGLRPSYVKRYLKFQKKCFTKTFRVFLSFVVIVN